ncbi:hypothetical protein [Intrasporangium flavum]|uniref:hypothetical protein n=1 Tax=Intrasporangium flavum TaxID=1428657 RepID=UPI00096C2048|nr:hypothetical protein [Intrasporangium flavum]
MSRTKYHPTDVLPGRGAGAGVGVAAFAGMLYGIAFTVVRFGQTGATPDDAPTGVGLALTLGVAAWIAATPLSAVVGASLRRAPRPALVAGYTVAGGLSLVLLPSFFSVFPGVIEPAVLVVSAACAVGASLLSALALTWPRRRRPTRSMRPGATVDPAQVPAQQGGGLNPASMTGPSPIGLP